MPGRKIKPPRLWQRKDGSWVIIDRGRHVRTGCKGSDADTVSKASQKLGDYIGGRHVAAIGERDPDRLAIADVLAAFELAKRPPQNELDRERARRHSELISRLERLNEFFGDLVVASLKAQTCRDYVAWRMGTLQGRPDLPVRRHVSSETARRELEDLRAAINLYHREHVLKFVPRVTLPDKTSPRDRWLTRSEAARLLGAALGFVWDPERKLFKRTTDGRLERRDRMTRNRRRHAARFILLGLYSGRREQTLRRTLWLPSPAAPWLDLDRWIYHGRGRDERRTRKRRPPAAIADRLRPHLARWQRLDEALAIKIGKPVLHVIHKQNGEPLRDKITTAWDGILADAALDSDVVRHTLRHTSATWQMQAGTDLWLAAGFLGMTVEQLEDGYAHHHPDFQAEAASAFGGRGSR